MSSAATGRNQVVQRLFGRTDLRMSTVGLGCARLGGMFKREPAEFTKILDTALDAGINFFDTSNIYAQGESEVLIGRTFRRRREQVIFATKAGYVLPSQRKIIARLKPLIRPLVGAIGLTREHVPRAVRGDLVQDFSPTHLEKSIEQSLRRLRTDRIDLFQLHSPPLAITSSDDWIDALVRLKQAGKIRYYGVSCDDPDAAFAALDKAGLSSIQVPLNLLERRSLGVIERAHQGDVAVIARECLANGLLVKALSPAEVRSFCETDDEAEHKSIRIQEYRREATQTGRSLVQMALNYVTSLPGVSVTLIGVSRLQQLESLLSELPATSNSDRRASSLA